MVQVLGLRIHIEKPCNDLAGGLGLLQVVQRRLALSWVEIRSEFSQLQHGPIMLLNELNGTGGLIESDRLAPDHHVEVVQGLIMLPHIIEALSRARVVVKGDARADYVKERGALMLDRRLDERHELRFVV